MKTSELIKALNASLERFGDKEVNVGTASKTERTMQPVADVLTGLCVLLESKEYAEADPINHLPVHSADQADQSVPH